MIDWKKLEVIISIYFINLIVFTCGLVLSILSQSIVIMFMLSQTFLINYIINYTDLILFLYVLKFYLFKWQFYLVVPTCLKLLYLFENYNFLGDNSKQWIKCL